MKAKIQLQDLMRKNGFENIEQLHKATKIGRSTLSDIANCKTISINNQTIAALCQTFNCKFGDLITLEESPGK